MIEDRSNSHAGYHSFADEDGHEYGSFEVFWNAGGTARDDKRGWYWWACFPGCMPDGEAAGPFDTSEDAFNDAREGSRALSAIRGTLRHALALDTEPMVRYMRRTIEPNGVWEMRQRGDVIWQFETARFRVELRVEPEDLDPVDSFEFEDDIQAVRNGTVEWFQACVDVVLKDTGAVLGRDTLGACAYATFEEFYQSHRTSPYEGRNTLAAKALNISVCHYFPSMVATACEIARKYGDLKLRKVAP